MQHGKYHLLHEGTGARRELLLAEDHAVAGGDGPEWRYWREDAGALIFLSQDGIETARFTRCTDGWHSGPGPGPSFRLRRISPYRSRVQPRAITHWNPVHVAATNHNPALLRLDEGHYLVAVRTGWFPGHSHVYLAVLDRHLCILRHRFVDSGSIQDPKLVWHRGEVRMVYGSHGAPVAWMATIDLAKDGPRVRWDTQVVLDAPYPGKRPGLPEKNWGPFVHDNRLLFIYRRSPQVVLPFDDVRGELRYDPGLVTHVCFDQAVYRHLHGNGNPVRISERHYLATFHHRQRRPRNYVIGYCLFEAQPPFRVVRMGREPLLDSRALPEELQCADPGQTSRGVHGYENGSNLVFLSTASREGDDVFFGLGLNDVRTVFLRYSIADLVEATAPVGPQPIPSTIADELGDVEVVPSTRMVQDRGLVWRNGYLECGETSACVRWTNATDDVTLLLERRPLAATRLLSFEIGRRCNLAHLHLTCPIHDEGRYDRSPVRVPITDDLIVNSAVAAYRDHGFAGYVTFWGYNEPTLDLKREVAILDRVRREANQARFLMLTNGAALTGDAEELRALGRFDRVVVNDYQGGREPLYRTLARHCELLVRERPRLDDRRRNYDGPEAPWEPAIGCCFRPNYELCVDHYGNVLLCCNDFRNETEIGNIRLQALGEVLRDWRAAISRPTRMGLSEAYHRQAPALCRRCVRNTPLTRLRDMSWLDTDDELFGLGTGSSARPQSPSAVASALSPALQVCLDPRTVAAALGVELPPTGPETAPLSASLGGQVPRDPFVE